MAIRKLEKPEWGPYLGTLSKALTGRRVEIEVDSLRLGSQVEAEWLPLLGITYDARSDALDIALDGLGHAVRKPRALFVDQDLLRVDSLEVIDGEGERSIVKFREPLLLPSRTRPSGPAF